MNDFPDLINEALKRVHPSWQPVLAEGLTAMSRQSPDYLHELCQDEFLPTQGRLFAAFSQPMDAVRYVLIGEGPYPREDSASGYCFMDAAVRDIWSDSGLSKQVNRATSLRNFVKMLLVADGMISPDQTGSDTMKEISAIARQEASPFIRTLPEMQETMIANGFLLLNAALVFRPHVAVAKETKAWQPFMLTVLQALAKNRENLSELPVLILWGKMAEKLIAMPFASSYRCVISEHPYNLSFIRNTDMQALFKPMRLLYKKR
ncbi:hypothetical protein [Oxalobacter formigenes]|uniref:Uracil-DNA glycosylase n=1 Tax=Oxalobacter formigenes OXCC13 TaxID=556269 RepID=C3XA29_OXAFO|nr:hypothetical protein [Oxalobacter formigenes]ARQ45806.1 uracil-DNA glycosylase [Oxalobacter formigenes]ARQ78036.1 uracil-DNA glycosylase [Oxalobacter formigenes OXCC13]EEO30055.1 hypothetical protein OFBG_01083 [Oxalobacter formigenes OXCC13]MCZ4062286.1 uracil-DNA glycosylase [Oxalobacter formigenes]QDX33416.1 uracil-DNA glycosylase [Oxalobacter formigenes]